MGIRIIETSCEDNLFVSETSWHIEIEYDSIYLEQCIYIIYVCILLCVRYFFLFSG